MFFSNIIKKILPSINYAVTSNDKWLLTCLLKLGKNVNKTDEDGYFPLRLSFNDAKDNFSFLLLEHGANPNAKYLSYPKKEMTSLLQERINRQMIHLAKLLIFYGASIDGIHFGSKDIETTLLTAHEIYKQQIAPFKNEQTPEAYQKLAKTWQQISDQENSSLLKKCYEDKALSYREKLQQLEATNTAIIQLSPKLKRD